MGIEIDGERLSDAPPVDVVTRHTWRGVEEPVRVRLAGDRAYAVALGTGRLTWRQRRQQANLLARVIRGLDLPPELLTDLPGLRFSYAAAVAAGVLLGAAVALVVLGLLA